MQKKLTCGGYEIVLDSGTEVLETTINGDAVTLNIAVSASGARYIGILNDQSVELWSKGENWTLYINDGEPIECK
jgi:membrane-bound inhibitor of C-type lysozyme